MSSASNDCSGFASRYHAQRPPKRDGSQPQKARPGNFNASTHGGRTDARIKPIARTQKRRLLRQIGLAASDLDGVGRALLDNWARCQAKVELLDRHFESRGFLDSDGEPVPAAKVYFTATNSARLALDRLNEHLKTRNHSPLPALEGGRRRLRLEAEKRLRAVP